MKDTTFFISPSPPPLRSLSFYFLIRRAPFGHTACSCLSPGADTHGCPTCRESVGWVTSKPATGAYQNKTLFFQFFSRTRGGLVFIFKDKQPLKYNCVKQANAFYTHANTQMHLGHVLLLKEGAAAAAAGGGTQGEPNREQRARAGESEPESPGSGLNLTVGNATTVCLQAVTEARQRCWRPPRLTANTRPSQTEEVASQGRTTGRPGLPAGRRGRVVGEGGRVMHSRLRAPLHFHHGGPRFFVSRNKSRPPVSSTPVPV